MTNTNLPKKIQEEVDADSTIDYNVDPTIRRALSSNIGYRDKTINLLIVGCDEEYNGKNGSDEQPSAVERIANIEGVVYKRLKRVIPYGEILDEIKRVEGVTCDEIIDHLNNGGKGILAYLVHTNDPSGKVIMSQKDQITPDLDMFDTVHMFFEDVALGLPGSEAFIVYGPAEFILKYHGEGNGFFVKQTPSKTFS